MIWLWVWVDQLVGVAQIGVNDSVKTMSLRLSKESQLTKSALEFSNNRHDPALQSWINKGGPGLSSQSQHIKSDKKLPPHPDFTLKGTEPAKRVRRIVIAIAFWINLIVINWLVWRACDVWNRISLTCGTLL